MSTIADLITAHKHADEVFVRLQQALRETAELLAGAGASFEARERTMLEASNEACRLNLQRDLQDVADA